MEGERVQRVVQVDGEGDEVGVGVVGGGVGGGGGSFFGLLGGACGEEGGVGGEGDGLDGEEDVRAADGVGGLEGLGGALGGSLDAAAGVEEFARGALGADAREPRALAPAVHDAQVARGRVLAPPGAVVPGAGGAAEHAALVADGGGVGGLGARVAGALHHHEVAAFDLRHDAGEGLVDERVQRGVVLHVVRGVDLQALVCGDGGGDVGDDGGEGWEGAGAQVGAWRVC